MTTMADIPVVLLIEQLARCDGSSTHVRTLARLLRARGVRVTIVAGDAEADVRASAERDGVTLVELRGLSHRRRSPGAAAGASVRLWRELARLRPALVHAHHFYAGTLALPWCRLNGIPMVFSMHETLDARGVLPVLPGDVLIGMSPLILSSMLRLEPLRGNRMHCIVNGVDMPRDDDRDAGRREHPELPDGDGGAGGAPLFRITCAGRFVERKGMDVLLEALDVLPEPDGVECVLAGEGPMHDALLKRARTLRCTVRFPGVVTDMAALYRRSDCVIQPSVEGEGFGLAAVEAGAHARAVITTDLPTQNTIVTHEVNGLLVPAGDAGALAQAIMRFRTDAPLRRRLGLALRETVRARYTADAMVDAVMRVYEEVLSHR